MAQWKALPNEERFDLLAREHQRQELITSLLTPMMEQIRDGEAVDVGSFVYLCLEQV